MIARALAACLVSTSRAAGAVPASPLDMDMRPIWRARRRRAASLTAWPRHSAASPAAPPSQLRLEHRPHAATEATCAGNRS